MKNLTPRDILEVLLFIIAFVGIFALAGTLESKPSALIVWMTGIVALILWVFYLIIVIHQRKAESQKETLWMMLNGEWRALDGSGRTKPSTSRQTNPHPTLAIFDQDDYKDEA